MGAVVAADYKGSWSRCWWWQGALIMPRKLRVQNTSAGGQSKPDPRNLMTFLRRCGGKLPPHGSMAEADC